MIRALALFVLPALLAVQGKSVPSLRKNVAPTDAKILNKQKLSYSANGMPNVFELPEEYAVAEFHKDHPLYSTKGVSTEAAVAGYLYGYLQFMYSPSTDDKSGTDDYYFDSSVCVNEIQPNFATGVIMNTCLAVTDRQNSSVNAPYSLLYTCNGGKALKTIYAGGSCNPMATLGNTTYLLNQCSVYLEEAVAVFGCSPYSNTLPLPATPAAQPVQNWLTNKFYDLYGCGGPLVQYTSYLNGACIGTMNYNTMIPTSVKVSYPSLTYYQDSWNCTTQSGHNPRVDVQNTVCANKGTDDDNRVIIRLVPFTVSTVTTLQIAEGFTPATSAPSMPPTAAVVTDQSVTYRVVQSLLGLDSATYRQNTNANNKVVTSSVAASMKGVSASNIAVVAVTDSPSTMVSKNALTTQGTLCYITYNVYIPSTQSAGYINGNDAFTKTTNQLKSNVNNGKFNTNVQTYATAYSTPSMNGVTSLGAQSSSYSATTNSSNDDDNSILPLWAIIVIAVGGFLLLVCLCSGAYFLFAGKKSSDDSSSSGNTGTNDKKVMLDNPMHT